MSDEPIYVMLADDDESDRMNFKEALEEGKIKTTVVSVNDGVELMEYLLQEDTQLPTILFLDLNMPRKNGLECLIEIRKNERLKEIVVAIYSTSSSEIDIEHTFNSGANVYIKKPNNFAKLKSVLNEIVMYVNLYRDPPFNLANFLLKI
jgi:CheY-like chemotaxis protein